MDDQKTGKLVYAGIHNWGAMMVMEYDINEKVTIKGGITAGNAPLFYGYCLTKTMHTFA